MSAELSVLVAAAGLSLALALATIGIHLHRFGGAMVRSNREDYPALQGLAGRVVRAQANLNEAMLPFAVVVLAAALAQVSNGLTAAAAETFLAARLAHAGLYLAGVPVLRSVAYYVGLAATLVFAAQLPLPAIVG